MFIKKNRNRNEGTYLIIFLILLFPFLYIIDENEHPILAWVGLFVLLIISHFIGNKITEISNLHYKNLKNDIKEDVLKEVLEELDKLENKKKN